MSNFCSLFVMGLAQASSWCVAQAHRAKDWLSSSFPFAISVVGLGIPAPKHARRARVPPPAGVAAMPPGWQRSLLHRPRLEFT
jgi:hypothetical protein